MKPGLRHRLAVVAVALAGVTCAFPTDKSSEVYVTIETPALALINGDIMSIRARAWRLVGGTPDSGNGDDVELVNVEFQWTSADELIAIVEKDCCGYATVTGLDPGVVDITARLVAFEQATDATLPLRVSNFIEIDSVTPAFVRWGGKLTLWGVGVQFASFPNLGGERLIADTLTFRDSLGLSSMEFWVPPPAQSGFVTVVGPGFFFTIPNLILVDTVDIFEPNDTLGTPFNLDAPGPYPQAPTLLFNNPALAFEEIDPSSPFFYRQDYYRHQTADSTRAMSFIVRPERVADTSQLFFYFTDSLDQSGGGYSIPPSGETWIMGQGFGFYGCNYDFAFFDELPAESTVIAFRTLPSRVIQNVNFYHDPGSYAMRVVEGYLTADPRIGPDRFEENDLWCKWADANYSRGDSIVVSRTRAPFVETLTIDNPHDIDWYRFRVLGAVSDTVVIRTAPRPFPGELDRSDIDLYVYDASPNPFNFQASAQAAGSVEDLQVVLPPGDYYLGVVDYPGAATRYGLCMTVGFNQPCIPPGATSATFSAALSPVRPRATLRAARRPPTLDLRRLPLRRP